MKLGRVIGTVVSTIDAPDLHERTLLLCDLLDTSGAPAGGYLIAVDSVGAGAGEMVLLLDEGNSARQVLAAPGAPIRAVIVGIVDEVTNEAEGAVAAAAVAAAGARPRRPRRRRAGEAPRRSP